MCPNMAVTDSREIVIEATPDEIMDVLFDLESLPEWSAAHKEVEVLERDDQGRPSKSRQVVKIVGVSDEQVLAYSVHDDGVSWTLVSAKQQRAQAGLCRIVVVLRHPRPPSHPGVEHESLAPRPPSGLGVVRFHRAGGLFRGPERAIPAPPDPSRPGVAGTSGKPSPQPAVIKAFCMLSRRIGGSSERRMLHQAMGFIRA